MHMVLGLLSPAKFLVRALLILGCLGVAPAAFAGEYGDWSVSVNNQMRIANTSNDVATIGIGCRGTNDCFAYIASKLSHCQEGETTPLLLTSSNGSAGATTVCKRVSGELVGIFDNPDALKVIALNEEGFKIVVPLPDGVFQISGFSSRGAMAALKTISGKPQDKPEAAPRNPLSFL